MSSEAQDLPATTKTHSLVRAGFAGAASRASVLVGMLVVLAIPASLVGYFLHEMVGVQAAVTAMVLCLSSGLLALFAAEVARLFGYALGGTLLAMGIRSALPMAVLLIIHSGGGPLVDAGFAFYTLVFYLAVLSLETFMEVNVLKASQETSGT